MTEATLSEIETELDALIDAAESFEERGWQIVPCDGKTPNVMGWPYRDFTVSEVGKHLQRAADPALGVKMGEGSNLVDIEWDSPAQYAKAVELFGDALLETVRFDSKNGGHALFPHDSRLGGFHTIHIPVEGDKDLIVRCGPGAQSVFPPSKNKQWINPPEDCILLSMPEVAVAALLEAKQKPGPPIPSASCRAHLTLMPP